jgi:hypothetical protein
MEDFDIEDCTTEELITELNSRSWNDNTAAVLMTASSLLEEEALALFKERFKKGNIIELINLLKGESKST